MKNNIEADALITRLNVNLCVKSADCNSNFTYIVIME